MWWFHARIQQLRLGFCQGNCESDEDCVRGMVCYISELEMIPYRVLTFTGTQVEM
jgi:hypothetical protein